MTEADTVATGVPPLDSLLPPAPTGATILYRNEPGIEMGAILYQAAHRHLVAGRDVVYVVVDRSPSSVVAEMEGHGFPSSDHVGQLHFVDAFSALLGADEEAQYQIEDPSEVSAMVQALERAAKDHPGAVCLVDSLSGLLDRSSPGTVLEHAAALHTVLDAFDLAEVLFTTWPYDAELSALLDPFDAVVGFGGLEDRILFSQYFEVECAGWADGAVDGRRHLFKTQRPGGVFVYIPKIVVTGPYNSGKSTFVHTVSDEAVSVDRLGTTVALDHGHVTVEGITADLFGTPGQARFDPILQTVAGQALGVLVLVDATKPGSFDRGRDLMEKTREEGLPALVVANKQDLPSALSPEEVAREMRLDPDVEVIGCQATDRASAKRVLERMSQRILVGGIEA